MIKWYAKPKTVNNQSFSISAILKVIKIISLQKIARLTLRLIFGCQKIIRQTKLSLEAC